MSEPDQLPFRRTWHGYPSWAEYLKANMALMPLIALCGTVVLYAGDTRYMVRAEDGEALEAQIEQVQEAVNEVRTEQRVVNGEIGNLKDDIQDVKDTSVEINRKLDRLIERESGR